MKKLEALVILATVFSLSSSKLAMADKYTCTAVDSLAKVGVYRGNEVGVEEDTDDDECRFSINGATTDSPPLNLVLEGLNAIRVNARMIEFLENKDVMPLAYLLLAPSQQDSPTGELISVLQNNLNELRNCFEAFEYGKIGFDATRSDMHCRVIAPGDSSSSFGGISTVITIPQLQLRIAQGNRNLYLFVPITYRNREPLIIQ